LHTLTFGEQINYTDDRSGICLEVVLAADADNTVSATAKLDTGSTFCVFEKSYADLLGLDLETGEEENFRTATGSFRAFGHEVMLKFAEIEFLTTVYFAEDEHFPVSVLGRIGFLDRLQIGLIDCEQLLFVDSVEGYYQ
jgi:predicted aspartyl protease